MEQLLIYGALGGVGRGLVGYIKYFLSYKDVRFSWNYFMMSVVISALAGGAAMWVIDGAGISFADEIEINPAIAFIIGYAGGDALENLYKIVTKNPTLLPLSSLIRR